MLFRSCWVCLYGVWLYAVSKRFAGARERRRSICDAVVLGYGGEVLRVAKEGDIGVFVNKLVFSCFLLYRFCCCFLSILPSWRRAI